MKTKSYSHLLCHPSSHHVAYVLLFMLTTTNHLTTAEISVISQNNETIAVFFDVELGLGGPLPSDGVLANVVLADPDDACSPIAKAPIPSENSTIKWFVLTKRFPCSFVTKMRNAIAAGFDGLIVYNIETNARKNISYSHFPSISAFDGIPAILISNDDGLALRNNYLYDRGFFILVTPDFSQNLLSYLLPFAVVIGVCLIIMISFMIVKCVRDRRKSRRHRLSSKHLKKIPTTKFKKGDHYDTCAICLDEYVDGEKLRVLPCGHVYHMKCIDPWLTKNRRVCPVCKGKVVLPGITDPTDSESEAENAAASERTPLVSNPRVSRWRRIRTRSRPAAAAAATSPVTHDPSPVPVPPQEPSPPLENNFPVTSGHLSVNCDEREAGLEAHESSISSTIAVVEVETRPHSPRNQRTASSQNVTTHSSHGRRSRRSRRNDAIV